ncbi:hypothetical protein T484DRAFT_1987289, partial [Baffinella frigidus]
MPWHPALFPFPFFVLGCFQCSQPRPTITPPHFLALPRTSSRALSCPRTHSHPRDLSATPPPRLLQACG